MMRSSGVLTLLFAAGAAVAVQAQTTQVSDSSAAAAVVTDYLGLLRIAGRWGIVSKLYVAERR